MNYTKTHPNNFQKYYMKRKQRTCSEGTRDSAGSTKNKIKRTIYINRFTAKVSKECQKSEKKNLAKVKQRCSFNKVTENLLMKNMKTKTSL